MKISPYSHDETLFFLSDILLDCLENIQIETHIKNQSSFKKMVESSDSLENQKARSLILKHWSCRQFLMILFSIGATVLAYSDPSFRDSYADLIKISLGGYLGQMLPKG